jgi:protoheme IX farnesyltransferase
MKTIKPNVFLFFVLVLVATTAAYGFIVAPLPINIPLLICATLGTVLTSASANTVNQLMEIPYDAQMKRTRNRVLVLGQMRYKILMKILFIKYLFFIVSYRHAIGFATVTLISGVSILTFGCNPLTGFLGLSNFLLYTCVYTPMKRKHIINTWIGSIVGAIPPVMGWTACTGSIDEGKYKIYLYKKERMIFVFRCSFTCIPTLRMAISAF